MNIAIIIERFDPQSGGAERSTAELAADMQARGHQITILTGKYTAPASTAISTAGNLGGMQVRLCPTGQARGALRLWLFNRWAQRELASGNFDSSLSVTSSVPATLVEPRAGLIADIRERSMVWRANRFQRIVARIALALDPRQHMLLALERRTFRKDSVRWFVGISQMMVRRSLHHYPWVAGKVVHVPNSVKPIAASPEQIAAWRTELRRTWQVDDQRTLFFFPAFDSRRKGFAPLLHALALMRSKHPDMPWLLIIAGRLHFSQHGLIRRLELENHVRDTGAHADLRPLYAAIDVTVLPTYYDSYGRVAIESLLFGHPAVTTSYAGAAELVAPPAPATPRGRVVEDPDDHAALAQALFDMCDPTARRECTQAIGAIAREYTTARHVDRLLELMASARDSRP